MVKLLKGKIKKVVKSKLIKVSDDKKYEKMYKDEK